MNGWSWALVLGSGPWVRGAFWTRSVRLCMQMFGMMSLQYVRMMKLRAFISPINGSTDLITGYVKRK